MARVGALELCALTYQGPTLSSRIAGKSAFPLARSHVIRLLLFAVQ